MTDRDNWKDWLEGIGFAAIVASLFFVGLQMRQAQKIARAEAFHSTMTSRTELGNSIKSDINIWLKGTKNEDLTNEQQATFEILVDQLNVYCYFTYIQISELLEEGQTQFVVNDFARILYENRGARRVWLERETAIAMGRQIFDDSISAID